MRYQGKYATNTKSRLPLVLVVLGLAVLLAGVILLLPHLADKKEPTPTEPPRLQNGLTADCFAQNGSFLEYTAGEGKIGIDVSSHQGEIAWEQVRAAGVDVAIVRIGARGYTEGGLIRDDFFHKNVVGAHAVGIETGAYFFSQAISVEEAAAEANAVCEWVAPYDMTYPIVFDWERQITGRTAEVDYEMVLACAKTFCEIITQNGYQAGFYFNLEMSRYMDLQELEDYHLWLAEYSDCPSYPYKLDAWQYSSDGAVEGISGAVDLDIFFP